MHRHLGAMGCLKADFRRSGLLIPSDPAGTQAARASSQQDILRGSAAIFKVHGFRAEMTSWLASATSPHHPRHPHRPYRCARPPRFLMCKREVLASKAARLDRMINPGDYGAR